MKNSRGLGARRLHKSDNRFSPPIYVLSAFDQQIISRIKITKPSKRTCTACGREVRDIEGMFKKGIHRDRVCLECYEAEL